MGAGHFIGGMMFNIAPVYRVQLLKNGQNTRKNKGRIFTITKY